MRSASRAAEIRSSNFAAEMAGIRLCEIFGTPDVEVHPAEVTITQPGQPGPDFRWTSTA